jgi:hypothetical protein
MLHKLLVVLCLITLFTVAASAASAEVSFSRPAQLGATNIQKGVYKIKVMGSIAMFTSTSSDKSYSAAFVPEKLEKRPEFTTVVGATENGVQKVDAILLGGQDLKLLFK